MKVLLIVGVLAACVLAQQGVPPFLQGAPQNVINEFRQLLSGAQTRTDRQMEQEIEAWASRQSPQIQQRFQQFKQQLTAAIQQGETAHQAAVARLSPAARQADAQLTAIAKNPSLQGGQKQAQIQQILNSLPANVKQELQQAMQG